MTAPLITAGALTMRFGGLIAVDQVDFAIGPSEMIGVIGPNGAGKTTLLNLLSGVARPSAGAIVIAGENLTGQPPHVFAWRGVARTFQTARVFAAMTVADNIRFGLSFAGRQRRGHAAALDTVEAILAFLGLVDEAEFAAGNITPARRRRLEIGMALATRPRVLLLDEVAAGLSDAESEELARLIRHCRDDLALAVVWIEHAVSLLFRHVERVAVLHQGRLIADGTPADVARDAGVIAAYLGDNADAAAGTAAK